MRKICWIRRPLGALARRKQCGHAADILSMAPGLQVLGTEQGPVPADALNVRMKQGANPGLREGL